MKSDLIWKTSMAALLKVNPQNSIIVEELNNIRSVYMVLSNFIEKYPDKDLDENIVRIVANDLKICPRSNSIKSILYTLEDKILKKFGKIKDQILLNKEVDCDFIKIGKLKNDMKEYFTKRGGPGSPEYEAKKINDYKELVKTKVIPLEVLFKDMKLLNWWDVLIYQQLPKDFIKVLLNYLKEQEEIKSRVGVNDPKTWKSLNPKRENELLKEWIICFVNKKDELPDFYINNSDLLELDKSTERITPVKFFNLLRKFTVDNVNNNTVPNPLRLLNNYVNIVGKEFIDLGILLLIADTKKKDDKIKLEASLTFNYDKDQLLNEYVSLQLVDWNEVSRDKLFTYDFIDLFKNKLNWEIIASRWEYISNPEFIERFKSKLNLNIVSYYLSVKLYEQNLSEEEMINIREKANKIFKLYEDLLNWKTIIYFYPFNEEEYKNYDNKISYYFPVESKEDLIKIQNGERKKFYMVELQEEFSKLNKHVIKN